MKKKTRIEKKYIYEGFGFPVELENVEFNFVRDEWMPKIDILELEIEVARNLSEAHFKLTGNHIHFIRSFLKQSLREFAKTLHVSHAAVKKWETYKNEKTDMSNSTELMIKVLLHLDLCKLQNKKLDKTGEYLFDQFFPEVEEEDDTIYAKLA